MLSDGKTTGRIISGARIRTNAMEDRALMAYNTIHESMIKYLEGQIAKHTINAQVFMKNPVGVAEHPDTMATIEEELGKIAEYSDKLQALNGIGYNYPDPEPRSQSEYLDKWQKSEW